MNIFVFIFIIEEGRGKHSKELMMINQFQFTERRGNLLSSSQIQKRIWTWYDFHSFNQKFTPFITNHSLNSFKLSFSIPIIIEIYLLIN